MKAFFLIGSCLMLLYSSLGQLPANNEKFRMWLTNYKDSLAVHQHQIDFRENLAPKGIQTDLLIIKKVLEEAQTTLNRFSTSQKTDSAFQYALQKANDSLTYPEFIREVAKIQGVISCGHSGWGHARSYFSYRNEHIRLFPFDILIAGDKYFIKRNNSLNPEIQDYTEIVAINNTLAKDITEQLLPYMVKDGHSNAGQTDDVERYFSIAYSNFIANPESFQLKMRKPNGEMRLQEITPLLKPRLDSIRTARYGSIDDRGTPLRFTTIDSLNTSVYTITWFNRKYIASHGQDFMLFTDSVFNSIKEHKIQNLIIDLRGNSGGWTANGRYLFSYFIDQPTPYMSKVEVQNPGPYSFEPIITSKPGYSDTIILEPNKQGLFTWENYPSLIAEPRQNRFNGQVYILTDGFTRSCGGMFCSLMQEHTNAIFIGEETGSTCCGSGGMVMAIELPYTGLNIHFSTAKYSCAISNETNSRGVIPTYPVSDTPLLIEQGYDASMAKALELIEN